MTNPERARQLPEDELRRLGIALAPAKTKAAATARMYFLGNRVGEPIGRGSTEKKSALVALADFLEIDLRGIGGKIACGEAIAAEVGVLWDEQCCSTGGTITLEGLNRLVAGAVVWYLRQGRSPVRSLIRDIQNVNPSLKFDHDLQETTMNDDVLERDEAFRDAVLELAEPVDYLPFEQSRIVEVAPTAKLSDGTWRGAIAAIQGWLYLSDEIDETSTAAFDEHLARLLGLDPGADDLIDRLSDRMDRARAMRNEFLAAMDDASEGATTLDTARADWERGWEDLEVNDVTEIGGTVVAHAAVWPIADFRGKAEDRELNLSPSYQRADVWITRESQQLIESVLRGIPLPSVILLEQETPEGDQYDVVDGKQRLTSILRFMGFHPRAAEIVREKAVAWDEDPNTLLHVFRTDYPLFKQKWKLQERKMLNATEESRNYFPFPLRKGNVPQLSGKLEQLRGSYYSEIRELTIDIAGRSKKVRKLFEETSDYKIPVIIYKSATPKQVHEVFGLYNRQGKHLNAEELRNAIYHELPLMRALLATAGDTDGYKNVAEFLAPKWDDLSTSGTNLAKYGFVEAGYKRTKALSWVAATLLNSSDRVDSKSTANLINSLLEEVRTEHRHLLNQEAKVLDLMEILDQAVDTHAAIPDQVWAPHFKSSQSGGKWQELQLVASLTALAIGALMYGDDLDEVTDRAWEELSERSKTWNRPTKTQSKEQWRFIARVVVDFLDVLGIDIGAAHSELDSRFGTSGLAGLGQLATED